MENDSDPDGDKLTVTKINGNQLSSTSASEGIKLPSGAIVTMNPQTGCYELDPNGQFDSLCQGCTVEICFRYQITDGRRVDAAKVCTIITGKNDSPDFLPPPPPPSPQNSPPIAEDDSYRVSAENPSVSSNIIEPNDSDPEADNLTIVGFNKGDGSDEITNPSSTFTVSFSSGGEMTVDPNTGSMTYSAADYVDTLSDFESFAETAVYTVSDGNGGTDTATVTILVVGKNDPPTPEDDSETVEEGDEVSDCVL